MEMNVLNEVVARKFLLGDVSPEELERIQELAFADPDTFALIEATQEDLIDDFVNDELSSDEKERFQNYFLVQPGQRQNLRMGRALQQYWARDEQPVVKKPEPSPRPRPSIFDWLLRPATVAVLPAPVAPALLALLVALGVLTIFIIWRGANPPIEVKNFPTPAPATPTPDASPAVTPSQATPSPTPTPTPGSPSPTPRHSLEPSYAILIPGGPGRSQGEEKTLRTVSGRPTTLELPVINTSFESYQAVLEKDGETVKTWPPMRLKNLSLGKAIKVVAPPGLLQDQQHYRITVTGLSAGKSQFLDNYYFVVSN